MRSSRTFFKGRLRNFKGIKKQEVFCEAKARASDLFVQEAQLLFLFSQLTKSVRIN